MRDHEMPECVSSASACSCCENAWLWPLARCSVLLHAIMLIASILCQIRQIRSEVLQPEMSPRTRVRAGLRAMERVPAPAKPKTDSCLNITQPNWPFKVCSFEVLRYSTNTPGFTAPGHNYCSDKRQRCQKQLRSEMERRRCGLSCNIS